MTGSVYWILRPLYFYLHEMVTTFLSKVAKKIVLIDVFYVWLILARKELNLPNSRYQMLFNYN